MFLAIGAARFQILFATWTAPCDSSQYGLSADNRAVYGPSPRSGHRPGVYAGCGENVDHFEPRLRGFLPLELSDAWLKPNTRKAP